MSFRDKPEIIFAYGDGSDGGMTLISGTTLLNRDFYYLNANIGASAVLDNNCFRVFVKNNLVLNGRISCNGNDGGDGFEGVGSALGGNARLAQTLGGGDVGSPSYDEPTAPGPATSNSIGGSGGNAGGAGGGTSVTTPTAPFGGPIPVRNLSRALRGCHATLVRVVGGGGGAGGANEMDANSGGGGGGGAGVVMVSARKITGTGVIQAVGGMGGDASGSVATPGSGGGGGGIIIVTAALGASIGTSVAGGAAGTGGGGLPAAGAAGTIITIRNGLPK